MIPKFRQKLVYKYTFLVCHYMKDFMTQRLSQSRERAWNFIGPLAKWFLSFLETRCDKE